MADTDLDRQAVAITRHHIHKKKNLPSPVNRLNLLRFLPVNRLDREISRIREEIIVVGGRVDDDVEPGRHLGRDDDAERRHDGVNVARVFAAGIQNDVFAAKKEDNKMNVSRLQTENKFYFHGIVS